MSITFEHQLRQAASAGNLEALNQALSQGAQVNARDEFGDTALNLAAEYGQLEVVERLLAAGADLENLGGADKTPLMNATFAGHSKVVQLLLNRGARINRDLLSSLQLKVSILEENADLGMVNPAAAEAWRRFLDFMVETWRQQNSSEAE
jgi:ankyrin repeat protein